VYVLAALTLAIDTIVEDVDSGLNVIIYYDSGLFLVLEP
jgi:hypothetical protein